jgi:hypothetical protein
MFWLGRNQRREICDIEKKTINWSPPNERKIITFDKDEWTKKIDEYTHPGMYFIRAVAKVLYSI